MFLRSLDHRTVQAERVYHIVHVFDTFGMEGWIQTSVLNNVIVVCIASDVFAG